MPLLRRKSYTEKVEGRRRFLLRAGLFLLVFLAFEVVSGVFLKTYAVSSASMGPGLAPGDRLLASPLPYGPLTLFGKLPPLLRPGRGDLVVVRPPFVRDHGAPGEVLRALVRFVSLQLYEPRLREEDPSVEGPFLARVIALPGDEISMEDFVFKVRAADAGDALTEFEYSSRRYDIHKPALPEGWSRDFPRSGQMAPLVLGKDEYFVATDDRSLGADSRVWGPLGSSSFLAKVLLRYWPFARFGSP